MNSFRKNVIDINCLRKNGVQSYLGVSSDSVDTDSSDNSVNQMATAELIKISLPSQKVLTESTVEAESNQLSCGSGIANMDLRPVKKIRIRECSDLRHWWDAEEVSEESSECA